MEDLAILNEARGDWLAKQLASASKTPYVTVRLEPWYISRDESTDLSLEGVDWAEF